MKKMMRPRVQRPWLTVGQQAMKPAQASKPRGCEEEEVATRGEMCPVVDSMGRCVKLPAWCVQAPQAAHACPNAQTPQPPAPSLPPVSAHLLLVQPGGDPQVGRQRGAAIAQQQREVERGDRVALKGGCILRQAQAVLHPLHNFVVLQTETVQACQRWDSLGLQRYCHDQAALLAVVGSWAVPLARDAGRGERCPVSVCPYAPPHNPAPVGILLVSTATLACSRARRCAASSAWDTVPPASAPSSACCECCAAAATLHPSCSSHSKLASWPT